MILDNCSYNSIKLLHELCALSWFLEKHAIPDATTAKKNDCKKTLTSLKKEIDLQIQELKKIVHTENLCMCTCGCKDCTCSK